MSFKFDEMVSAPCRLGIMAKLVTSMPVSFTEMKTATSLSDGNLHVQTCKLADAGYIEINKTMQGRRTLTKFSITQLGRKHFRLHVMKLQKILNAEMDAKQPVKRPVRTDAKQPVKRTDGSAVWA